MREDEIISHRDVEQVSQVLVDEFGRPDLGNKRNPFNELLYIILSWRTPPEHYQTTYRALRRQYPRADDFAEAHPDEMAAVIELGGFQNKRARAIVSTASKLKETFGRVTLAPLRNMETEEAEKFLLSLPGVQTKTARCVLMYSLDRPVFPVDRHCFRIAQRLGWTPAGRELTQRLEDDIQAGVPPALRRDLHVGMIVLGRSHCLPEEPLCDECPLSSFCPTGKEYTDSEADSNSGDTSSKGGTSL